jgi:uncharacterized protein YndB with AHSA1/START domain
MTTEDKTTLALPSDTEIVITRVLDAPRDLVWKAWTDPAHLARWWGPVGFTTTTRQIEAKTGGRWRFVMHGPDGRDYENLITYTEVAEPERLAYRHGGEAGLEPVSFEVVVTFGRQGAGGDRTLVTMRSVFPSKRARDFVIQKYDAAEGGRQTISRLAEHVATMSAEDLDRPFEISRVFDAPRDLVWKAWTEAEHLPRWFSPRGVTISKSTLDLKVGGMFHYCMRMPDGTEQWGRWIFREILPPDRLVFVVSFADAAAKAVRAPFSQDWPLEMLATVTFAAHAGIGGGTVVHVRSEPVDATAAERRTFGEGHPSMRGGWTGTLDQLEAYLAIRRRPRDG